MLVMLNVKRKPQWLFASKHLAASNFNKCIPFLGFKNKKGYGRFWDGKKARPAPQVAWEIAHNKPFPKGKQARHTCDHPWCVNGKEHIIPGTSQEDANDRMIRSNTAKKMTWKEVREIRKKYTTGKYSQRELGRMYNVAQCTIGSILHNKIWKEIIK